MPDAEVFVTLGIDTHKHTHLAVALDQLGRRLDQLEIPTTTPGFAQQLGALLPEAEEREKEEQLRAQQEGRAAPRAAGA